MPNTAIPEDILFRGLILKRISNRQGFYVVNMIQSALFGALHGIMLSGMLTIPKVLVTILTGSITWLMGYINEKKAGGSIIPGIIIHAA